MSKIVDITQTSQWDEVLIALYERLTRTGIKKSGIRKVQIFLGEVDDEYSGLKVDVLDRLRKDKIVDSYRIKSYIRSTNHPDLFFARAECAISVTLKRFEKLLIAHSMMPKYKIWYDEERGLYLNDILIRGTHREGNRAHFWKYVIEHPNEKILQETLDEYVKKEVGEKKFRLTSRKIVNDYGFTGNLRKLFFPIVSTTATVFNNPITQKQIDVLKISNSKLEKQIKALAELRKKSA